MGVKPRAYDDGEIINVSSGSASSAGADSGLAEELLDATAALTRLSVLLSEASADDWRELKPRIVALQSAIKLLPKSAPRRKRVGY